ncbi:hypothetical protein DPEC_G00209400 [Dallia pectoralis]|uniref:Uncharacterized protein n=1 Tax=Dallia pectoralis TaxID=75939 RepID=A0ACC2G5T1_DALPE|nr:hypothetical protein DPEC_G00209400 [Dallia pectoralis]
MQLVQIGVSPTWNQALGLSRSMAPVLVPGDNECLAGGRQAGVLHTNQRPLGSRLLPVTAYASLRQNQRGGGEGGEVVTAPA